MRRPSWFVRRVRDAPFQARRFGSRISRCKPRVRCGVVYRGRAFAFVLGAAGRSKSSELSKSVPGARASGAEATKKPRSGCTPAGAFASGRRAAEASSAGLPIDIRETYSMNSPFMGRESEYGHGLPSQPRGRTGAVRRCGWRAPFAEMGEVFGKSVLSFRAGGCPRSAKGGAVYSPPLRCQPVGNEDVRRGSRRIAQAAATPATAGLSGAASRPCRLRHVPEVPGAGVTPDRGAPAGCRLP